jgi:hypothetical protein
MPVEIDSFTTEVTLTDKNSRLSGPQLEALIQEVLRRVERKQKEDQRAEHNASFGTTSRRD